METALFAFNRDNSQQVATQIAHLSDQMVSLIELGSVASALRREVGVQTVSYLMDIFGRLPPPDLASMPDEAAMERDDKTAYRIEGTPLRLLLIKEGDRQGEYLFSESTVQVAPRFFRAIMDLPLRTRLDISSYSQFYAQLTGPLIPAAVVRSMPEPLQAIWLGTPLWKIIAISILAAVLIATLAFLQRAMSGRVSDNRLRSFAKRTILPLAILVIAIWVLPFASQQINVTGRFAAVTDKASSIFSTIAYAWLLWLSVRMLFEWVIRSPRIQDESLDANLLRLAAGVIGIVGAAVILAFGGQAIGLPIMSVLAGLGIGGLAVALALRPTLENLVGGVMLYVDRPVRVGDFCSFGSQMGTVEGIGVRSTRLRALDRTLITVPNAQFADMQIINWAACDHMLIEQTIGLRYETKPDQLRYLLAGIRRMLHAHPRIVAETVRVRFVGYGPSALNVNIRVYARTREWNDFFAIREDVFLRLNDIVDASGSALAYPSSTLYLARDQGVDPQRSTKAAEAVERWRKDGKLPFPRLDREEIANLEGTLDYPPRGSTEARHGETDTGFGNETLSAAPEAPGTEQGLDEPKRQA